MSNKERVDKISTNVNITSLSKFENPERFYRLSLTDPYFINEFISSDDLAIYKNLLDIKENVKIEDGNFINIYDQSLFSRTPKNFRLQIDGYKITYNGLKTIISVYEEKLKQNIASSGEYLANKDNLYIEKVFKKIDKDKKVHYKFIFTLVSILDILRYRKNRELIENITLKDVEKRPMLICKEFTSFYLNDRVVEPSNNVLDKLYENIILLLVVLKNSNSLTSDVIKSLCAAQSVIEPVKPNNEELEIVPLMI